VTPACLEVGLKSLASALGPADVCFGNLETPLSDVGRLPGARRSLQLRGDPDYGAVLHSAGFALLGVANNHALEHGREAYRDSLHRIEGLGIGPCGLAGTDGWSARPITRDIGGVRVGILGYSLRPSIDDGLPPPHALGTESGILADVRRLRPDVDCLIVSLHWGEEFVTSPSAAEVAFGHAVIEAGARIVVGHHPHVARPVERYRGGVIAYSLGNFLADMIWHEPLRHGLVLDCVVSASALEDVRVHRVRLDRSFLPTVDQRDALSMVESRPVAGLAPDEYVRAARRTVAAQRRALYRYTLLNAWRFDPRVLAQLAVNALSGKVSRRARGERDEIWG
jgi:poly-gamma-glutamate synthesis protein (capsule biosynthesis protein)